MKLTPEQETLTRIHAQHMLKRPKGTSAKKPAFEAESFPGGAKKGGRGKKGGVLQNESKSRLHSI